MNKFGDFCVEKISNENDEYFLFDSKFGEEVSHYKWCKDSCGYPCAKDGDNVIRLHRKVVEMSIGSDIPDGIYVDHINQNKLDNRVCNLRLVTPTESAQNMPLREDNTSGVCGVSLDKRTGKYRAYITLGGKQKSLGQYKTISEAANARAIAEQNLGFKNRQNIKVICEEIDQQQHKRSCEK